MANGRYLLGYTQTLKRARFVSHPPGPPPHDHFTAFAKSVRVELDPGLEIASRRLLFMTATATHTAVVKLARFSFLRAIRPLPEPRPLEEPQLLRSATQRARLPQDPAVDPNLMRS